MLRTAVKLAFALLATIGLSGLAYAQTSQWSTQGSSGCSDNLGSFDAFIPGMRGFGSCNRGGFVPNTNVIVVTNRNASGSGSFAAAAEASCPKVILFAVSGVINRQQNTLFNRCNNWSVVGASAPGNVVVAASTLGVKGNNYTMDHLTIAPGDPDMWPGSWGNRDNVWIGQGDFPESNIILMNNTFLWSSDEGVQCYPAAEQTDVLYWQNIMAVPLNFATHGLAHIVHPKCVNNASIRNVYIHAYGRSPLVRADRYLHANNVVGNPGFQSILVQPCGGGGGHTPQVRMNIMNNLRGRGPDSEGHSFIEHNQGTSCLSGGLQVYENGNHSIGENCGNHGCAGGISGGQWQSSPISAAMATGYVPETISNDTSFVQKIAAHAGARPTDRLSYTQSKINHLINIIDGSGAVGGIINSQDDDGGLAALSEGNASWDPTDGSDNPCGENMPTGSAANAIQSSGLTRLHEWVIGCFYDSVMPAGYRDNGLQNYPAPGGGNPPPPPEPEPNPPSLLQIS